MRIYHNIPALNAYNNLYVTNNELAKSIGKLSSGLRINSAADDAAGLAISEKMRGQIRGLDMAARNAQDGISMVQTAEGALAETHSIIQRMRELAVQASNDTLTQQDRAYIQIEINQLREEIDRIANTTQFNKRKLLDGSGAALWSSDSLETKAYIRGALRQTDQFNQKNSAGGNYKIVVTTTPGQGEVKKSDIFKIKHKNVISNLSIDSSLNGITIDNLPPGNYRISVNAMQDGIWVAVGETISAGVTFSENTTYPSGMLISAGAWTGGFLLQPATAGGNLRFLSGSTFAGGTIFITTANGEIMFTAGTFSHGRFDPGSRFSNGEFISGQFAGGSEFAAGVFASGSIFASGSMFSAGVFASGSTFGAGSIFNSGTFTISANTVFANGTVLTRATIVSMEFLAGFNQFASLVGSTVTVSDQDGNSTLVLITAAHTDWLSVDATAISQLPDLADKILSRELLTFVPPLTAPLTVRENFTYLLDISDDVEVGYAEIREGTVTVADSSTADVFRYAVVAEGGFARVAVSETAAVKGYAVVSSVTGDYAEVANGFTATVSGNAVLASHGTLLPGTKATIDGYAVISDPDTARVADGETATVASTVLFEGNNVPVRLAGDGGILAAPARLAEHTTFNFEYTTIEEIISVVRMRLHDDQEVPEGVKAGPDGERMNVYQAFGLVNAPGLSNDYGLGMSLTGGGNFKGTTNILLEVTNVDEVSKTVTFKAVASVLFSDGISRTYVADSLQVREGEGVKWTAFGIDGNIFSLDENAIFAAGYSVGDKLSVGIAALSAENGSFISVSGTQNPDWPAGWGNGSLPELQFAVGPEIQGKEVHFRSFYLNTANGTVYESDIAISFKNDYVPSTGGSILATFVATYIGQVGENDTQLRDLDRFWDANGSFMLNEPQTLTISQGNGKSTTVTIYSTDTLGILQQKLNNAIGNGLGQMQYAKDNVNSFVTYVTERERMENTSQSVAGTFVIRSIIAGEGGKLSFAGNEELIKALSLNVITPPKENQFSVSVLDAHTGATIASNVSITGNMLVGVVHPNVDVEIDPMANIEVTWDDRNKKFNLDKMDLDYVSVLHLVDNSTIFQIGANQGEDMAIDMGNMGMNALGLHKIVVTDRESSTRALSILDNAMMLVSAQRARLGAFQNRLEYTVQNLTTTAENLTAAESRIRDLDMAKEMMNFTKLQILSQSGTSMLAQANQLPQAVLQLLRGS